MKIKKQIKFSLSLTLMLICNLVYSQNVIDKEIVKALLTAGYINVSCVEVGDEQIITFENSRKRVVGEGAKEALRIIDSFKEVEGVRRRVILLDDNIAKLSITKSGTDNANRWDVGYDLGKYWKQARWEKRESSSFGQVDLVFYPQLSMVNQKFHKMYDFLITVSPSLEVSLLRGMILRAQVVIPVFNEYGNAYDEVRWGYINLEQSFKIENIFGRITLGTFSRNRWGADLHIFRPLALNGVFSNFAIEGRVGLTGSSYFDKWMWHVGTPKYVTYSIGGQYYNKRFNTQCDIRFEKFLAGDYGVRADMTRHFKRVSVGVFAMKNSRGNVDGGFHFAVALPPYNQKRISRRFNVRPSNYFDFEYNAAGLFYNGHFYETRPGENRAEYNYNKNNIWQRVNE